MINTITTNRALIFAVLISGIVGGLYYYVNNQTTVDIPFVPFYFVRHGQTDDNFKKIVAGATDTPLNKTGKAQANAAAQALQDTDIKTIITSPLLRARETAKIIAHALHTPIIVMNEFAERSVGSFEGEREGEWIKKWVKNICKIPDAEDFFVFKNRVIHGLKKALLLPGPVLIVAHGGVFNVVQNLLQLHHDTLIKNALPIFITPTYSKNTCWHYGYISNT